MAYSDLGHTQLAVSKICLGTMTFGEGNTYQEACAQLDMASEAGVNFIDSAEMYPVPQKAETQGRSEEMVGQWMKERHNRDKIIVATKVAGPSGQMTWIRGGPHTLDRRNIKEAIDDSLRRLQTDYIDLYQIHWPDRYVPMFGDIDYDPSNAFTSVTFEEQLAALAEAKQAGKIRHVGLSNETPYGLAKFLECAQGGIDDGTDYPRVQAIQNAYHLLCRTFDSGVAEICHQEKVSLLAYSPLAMGHLTGKYLTGDGGPPGARLNKYRCRYAEAESRYSFTKPNLVAAVRAYAKLAEQSGLSLTGLALGFVLRHPLVASAVIGATSPEQLQELLTIATEQPPLSEDVMSGIDKIHRRYPSPAP
ncbi:aldo keto reductasefinger RINkfl00642_0040 [Klebsormidium nitens]|uniref:Aldo keto reductasefinger RINkfl00642_0040 n=1 Tax=Klebsormidium nitens TaxID=105231 RepID=A0A1Y1IPB9_KLENI|nr:aldo keto reductasefinger RINkfl00642_0040 [Klebsormidium nitens]|eukprot:GAQ90457.1 aldo keto reductasefinger RINkfl00642_0040 [Klebsormidium nitens]